MAEPLAVPTPVPPPPAAAPSLSLRLLGGIELEGAGPEAPALLTNNKAVALLAMLAVPVVGPYLRRDAIAANLWPELNQARARAAVRKTVHAVRRALGQDVIIGRGDEDIALSAAAITSDVHVFTRLADGGFLLQAVNLYRGELMPGFVLADCLEFAHWLDGERAAARERAAAISWALAQRFEHDEAFSDAAGMARRSVRFSWSDERALRRALAMLDRLGDRAGALRLFEEFARRLRADFEADPSPETMAIVDRLRGT